MPEFKNDHRESNPALHRLYVEFATMVLGEIDRGIRRLSRLSNIHASEAAQQLMECRNRFISEDAAYYEADRLMRLARGEKILLEDPQVQLQDVRRLLATKTPEENKPIAPPQNHVG